MKTSHPTSDSVCQFGTRSIQGLLARYGAAVALSAIALFLNRELTPHLMNNAFDFFYAAVFLSALLGGLGPGLVATGISLATLDYFFIPPLNTFTVGMTDLVHLSIFGVVAVLTSSCSAKLKRTKSELQKAHDGLEVRIRERTEELSRMNQQLVREMGQRAEAEKAIMEISHREQRRLGQDLHDGLCQTLAGVKLLSEELKEKLERRELPEAQDAEKIELHLREALRQADHIARGLYPVELETQGLMSALEELATKMSRMYPVSCRFTCPRPAPLENATIATHVFRIAQEAVINAIKSGKAKDIQIQLHIQDSYGLLSVVDNGIGMQHPVTRRGMGLKIMEYRTRVIHGSLAFRPVADGGTAVTCSFPIPTEVGVAL